MPKLWIERQQPNALSWARQVTSGPLDPIKHRRPAPGPAAPGPCPQVRPKPASASDATSAIVSWIKGHYPRGESGIVYCLTR